MDTGAIPIVWKGVCGAVIVELLPINKVRLRCTEEFAWHHR